MAEPWWKSNPQDLQPVGKRISTLYVEKCHVDRDENAVVLANREQTIRVPAAMLVVLLLGPGTRVTHAAMSLLADSGTSVCWVGEQGVRFYCSGRGSVRGSALVMRQAWLVTRKTERLAVARAMYEMRFPDEDVSSLTMQQLRGREGARVKKIYRSEATRTGVEWRKRDYKHGDVDAAGDSVNRLLSAGHACLYGLAHAVVAGIGASPALGFVHTGGSEAFVLDIADLYKAETTIPIAFDLAAAGKFEERDMRLRVRDRIVEDRLVPHMIRDIKMLLLGSEADDEWSGRHDLWDDDFGTLPGGFNWAAEGISDPSIEYHSVIGPELHGPAQ